MQYLHSPPMVWVVLVFGLCTTGAGWYISKNIVLVNAREHFVLDSDEITKAIHDRMTGYEQVLWGGVGLFRASKTISRSEWAEYVASLNISRYWPGIQGLGFSIPVTPQEKEQHIKRIRAEGFPEFTIKPEGEREMYSSIIYLEPFDWRNERAFGYDMWSNEMRREAMIRCRDTGKASTSGIITLVQETTQDPQKGFLTYTPYYKTGKPLESVEDRQDAFVGWVYSAFRMGDLMDGILESNNPEFHFEIYDGDDRSFDNLLFDSDQHSQRIDPERDSVFSRKVSITVQGRLWNIYFESLPEYVSAINYKPLPTIVAVIGITVDLLLLYVITSTAFLQKKASKIAREMTAELFEAKNVAEASDHAANQVTDELKRQKLAMDEHAIVSITDIKGDILYANDKFCEISGYMLEELQGNNHRIIKSDEHPPEFFREIWNTISNGKTWTGEIKNRKKDGTFYWVASTLVPFKDKHGKINRYFAIRTDITEQKRNEVNLHNAKIAAESANEAKSVFLANMSHEIRTPLHGILSFAQFGVDKALTAEPKQLLDYFQKIQMSGQRLLRLLTDILDLTKMESGSMTYDIEQMDLRIVVRSVYNEFRSLLANRNILIEYSEPDIKLMMMLDDNRMAQVVRNLISNAAKFSPDNSTIWINTVVVDDHVSLSIRDSGCGIPDGESEMIFHKFVQSIKGRTGIGGTGLGLSICKEIVEAHHGRIWCENHQDGGAHFHVILPIAMNLDPPDTTSELLGAK